jgi:hypothetical protein
LVSFRQNLFCGSGGSRLPQTTLMFAFKAPGANIRFRSGGGGRRGGADSRRQDPKTPVEQALMRGSATA